MMKTGRIPKSNMSKLIEQNPLMDFICKVPWIGEIQHNISDFNVYLEFLNKKFNQQLYKQLICNAVYFDLGILDKYKDKYLKSIPFVVNGGSIAHNFIFQIDYNLTVCFAMGKLENTLFVIPEFHSTCLGLPYNFILDNMEFIVEPNKKPLGFGG